MCDALAGTRLPDENFNQKPKSAKKAMNRLHRLFKGQEESQPLFVVLLFLCHQNQLYYKILLELSAKLKLTIAWLFIGAHSWCFSYLSWFVRLHTLGTMVLQLAYLSAGSFVHSYQSRLSFTPVLTTRITRAFQLP